MKAWILACALGFFATVALSSGQITTSQYDNLRTGATLSEKILNPLNAQSFGKLGAFKVDGPVYAQPLFVPGVESPGVENMMCYLLPPSTTASTHSMPSVRMTRPSGT